MISGDSIVDGYWMTDERSRVRLAFTSYLEN